jgi:hypothetical protein
MPSEELTRLREAGLKVSYQEHGVEHFHPDVGEYWLPEHIDVVGDMDDMDNLRAISDVCDMGWRVLKPNGVDVTTDKRCRLVRKDR